MEPNETVVIQTGIMPFDEINQFKQTLSYHFDENGRIRSREDCEDIIDEMFELFLLSYANGSESVALGLDSSYTPDLETVESTVYAEIAGKTWVDRVWEYFDKGGDEADINRIVDTESHRDSNAGAYNTAKALGATEKVWHCMMLDTSRDTHVYLDGVTAPIDGVFYTFKGNSTRYPGEFGVAEEDCNCLCWLTYR